MGHQHLHELHATFKYSIRYAKYNIRVDRNFTYWGAAQAKMRSVMPTEPINANVNNLSNRKRNLITVHKIVRAGQH